jgi:uncharacterized delta-60 repeat protein
VCAVGVLLAGALLLGLLPSSALAGGSLDTTFGGTGLVTTDFGQADGATDLAVDSSGRIVAVGGSGPEFAVARYLPNGSLDPSFGGGDGKVTANFGRLEDNAVAVDIDPSGRIVVGGTTSGDTSCSDCDFALLRLTESGILDSTFGDDDGKVIADMGLGRPDLAGDLAIDRSGRIVMVGTATGEVDPPDFSDFGIARFTEAGVLDTSFDSDGRIRTNVDGAVNDGALAVAMDGSGRIVVGGYSGNRFAVARYLESGALDTTFGGDGRAIADVAPGHNVWPGDIAVDASERPVMVGTSILAGPEDTDRYLLFRFASSGSPDATFGGGDGLVVTPTDSEASANGLAIDSSGRLVVAGSWIYDHLYADAALLRYLSDGSPDASFGAGGLVRADFGEGNDDYAQGVTIDSESRIVTAGSTGPFGADDFALARYLPEGAFVPPPNQEPPPPNEPPAEEPTGDSPAPQSASASPVPSSDQSPNVNPQSVLAIAAEVAPIKGTAALLRVRCGGQAVCRGVAKLVVRIRARGVAGSSAARVRNVVLGRSRFRVPAGRTKVLRIRLNRRAQRLLRRAGRRGLRARLIGRGIRHRTVRLKPQQGKKKRSGPRHRR